MSDTNKNQHPKWEERSWWRAVNSNMSLLVVGFLLSGVLGHHLSSRYQDRSWERDRRHEVFKQEIEEAKRTIEEVNSHISSRAYSLQKVHWALEAGDIKRANKEYSEYGRIKDDWNRHVRMYRNKLKRLVDYNLAFLLLDSENSTNIPRRGSVHSYFVDAHSKTLAWMRCVDTKCDARKERERAAYESLRSVFEETDKFIDRAYEVFLERYKTVYDGLLPERPEPEGAPRSNAP